MQPPTTMPTDTEIDLEQITLLLSDKGINCPSSIQAVYLVGSRLYGTAKPGSDYDFIVVLDSFLETDEKEGSENHFSYLETTWEGIDIDVGLYGTTCE